MDFLFDSIIDPSTALFELFISFVSVISIYLVKRFIASIDHLKEAISDLRVQISLSQLQVQEITRNLEKLDNRVERIETLANKP